MNVKGIGAGGLPNVQCLRKIPKVPKSLAEHFVHMLGEKISECT